MAVERGPQGEPVGQFRCRSAELRARSPPTEIPPALAQGLDGSRPAKGSGLASITPQHRADSAENPSKGGAVFEGMRFVDKAKDKGRGASGKVMKQSGTTW